MPDTTGPRTMLHAKNCDCVRTEEVLDDEVGLRKQLNIAKSNAGSWKRERDEWRARAEAAEAEVARVKAALEAAEDLDGPDTEWGNEREKGFWMGSDAVTALVRKAIEGEGR